MSGEAVFLWSVCALVALLASPAPRIVWDRPDPWEHPGMLVRWAWTLLTETDAEKAIRLLGHSNHLLERARYLTTRSRDAEAAVEDEFTNRLRLVSGDEP